MTITVNTKVPKVQFPNIYKSRTDAYEDETEQNFTHRLMISLADAKCLRARVSAKYLQAFIKLSLN